MSNASNPKFKISLCDGNGINHTGKLLYSVHKARTETEKLIRMTKKILLKIDF